jgi:hypothetical protein
MTDEEPAVTKIASKKMEIGEATMDIMILRVAKLWLQLDDMIRAMADIYAFHNKDVTKEEAYVRLKKRLLTKYFDNEV